MSESLLVKAFRYNRWANLHLLDACKKLSAEQLELTADGTYGTIAATLLHLLGAEQRYIRRLTGDEPRIGEESKFPGIPALVTEAEKSGDRLIELASIVKAEDEIDPARLKQYERLAAWVVLLQALHHGNDHRTHICTVLGAHGLEYGDMDVWTYGGVEGVAIEAAASC